MSGACGGCPGGCGAGAIEARPDVLVFTSQPLSAPLDVLGPVRAELHLRASTGQHVVCQNPVVADLDELKIPKGMRPVAWKMATRDT
jgi:predicted acyl esterase